MALAHPVRRCVGRLQFRQQAWHRIGPPDAPVTTLPSRRITSTSARASAIDLRAWMLCCGDTGSAATVDAGADAAGEDDAGEDDAVEDDESFGAARADLFFSSPMYQHLRLAA